MLSRIQPLKPEVSARVSHPAPLNPPRRRLLRWCQRGLQQLHTRWSCFGKARMGFINRLSSFDVALYWIASFPYKILMLASPAVYMWTSVSVIAATPNEIVWWLLPSVAGSVPFMSIFGRNLIVPVLTDVTQLLSASAAISNVAVGLFRPHGRAFKVTPKGVKRDAIVVQWRLMWPFLLIGIATLGGIAVNATPDSALIGGDGYAVNVCWSFLNFAMIGLFCLCCVEMPRRRTDERFQADEAAVVLWPGRAGAACRVRDISLGGARLAACRWDDPKDAGLLLMDDGRLRIPFKRLRGQAGDMVVKFADDAVARRALIARLFGGDHARELESVSVPRVFATLVSRLMG